MDPTVRAAFPAWIAQYEGCTRWLYLDPKGLVTWGYGYLADPIDLLPLDGWIWIDGTQAARGIVLQDWARIRSLQQYKGHGGGFFAALAQVRASAELMARVMGDKLDVIDEHAGHDIAMWHLLPPSVQLAVCRHLWAEGAACLAHWPKLVDALNVGDWEAAAEEIVPKDMATQPQAYRDSYAACQALIRIAGPLPESIATMPAT